jgi:hypothetical protein
VYKVWWERVKERDHSEHRGIDGRMAWGGGLKWIQLAQDRDW